MNKKMKFVATMATLLIVAAGIVILQSCKKEQNKSLNCQTVQNEIEYSDPTQNILFYNNINSNTNKESFFAKILKMRLYRKSRHCMSGFGICEIYIFGQQVYKGILDTLQPSREIYYELSSQNPTDTIFLLLATDVSNVDRRDLDLYVDEDIYGYDDNFTIQVMVPQGVYHYDQARGEYGGYAVNYTSNKIKK